MNVSCPECRTVYRVDPRKVPARGVRARCMRCPAEFEVPPSPASDDRDRGESFTAAGSREQQVEPRATAPEAAGPVDEGRAETESPGAPSPAPPLEPREGAHGARVGKTGTGGV